jgi:outer membrane protein, multidrug efflux system
MTKLREPSLLFILIGLLSACSTPTPQTSLPLTIPPQWQTSLPPDNPQATSNHVGNISNWWQQQTDPFLATLIEAAQVASPSVAQAFSRIAAARLELTVKHSARRPSLDASMGATRAHGGADDPPTTTLEAGLQTVWEIDLFNQKRDAMSAANMQLEGSQAQWHDARTLVAAEVANLYFDHATCRQLRELAQTDAHSWHETSRISQLSAKQGMLSHATVAQIEANAAQAGIRVIEQETQCSHSLKAMVALTGMDEADLKTQLARAQAQPAKARPVAVAALPAHMLRQRPDVFAAERNVSAASLQIGIAEARQYPSLTLNGAIGISRQASNDQKQTLHSWSIGPLTLNYPIFDAGQRKANIQLAKIQYQEAVISYTNRVRTAVQEVEQALLNLHGADLRQREADRASQNHAQILAATKARQSQGMASLLELEEARRLALTAQNTQLSLQLERNRAWVALYRALGGGWDAKATIDPATTATPTATTPNTSNQS